MTATKPATTTTTPPSVNVKTGQKGLNRILNEQKGYSTLIIIGKRGEKTRQAETMAFQRGLNEDFGCYLKVDGRYGDRSKRVVATHWIKEGMKGELVKALQASLYCHGFPTKGIDGKFGSDTVKAVKAFQKSVAIKADGLVGPVTVSELLK